MYQLTFPHVAVREAAPTVAVEAASIPDSPIIPELIDRIAADFVNSLNPETRKALSGRLGRGLRMAKAGHVQVTEQEGIFLVESSQGGFSYTVNLNDRTCTCPDHKNGHTCKHRIASYYIQQAIFQSGPSQVAEGAELTQEEVPLVSLLRYREAIVWGLAHIDDETRIPVEILESQEDTLLVRALPQIIHGELRPVFPFASPFNGSEVGWSTAELPRELVSHVQIYR